MDYLDQQPDPKMGGERLREEFGELRALTEGFLGTIPGAFIVLDSNWRLFYLNDDALKLFEDSEASLLGKPLEEVYPRRLGKMLSPQMIRELLEGKENTINKYTGHLHRWFKITAYSSDFGIFIRLEDITPEMLLNRLLRLNQFSINRARDMVFWFKSSGHIIFANRSACESLGYDSEELTKMKVTDIDPSYTVDKWAGFVNDLKMEKSRNYESSFRARDGSVIPVEVTSNYLDYFGEEYLMVFARDATERKRADEALSVSEASLARAQYITHLGNWEWDVKEDKVFCSDEFYRVFGLDRRDYITYGEFIDTLHIGDRDRVNRAVEAALYKGEPYSIDYRVIWPDGSEHIVHAEAEVTHGPSGEPVKMFGTAQDVTESKRTEEELRRSRDELDEKVRERTSELKKINEELEVRIQEGKKAEAAVRHSYAYNRSLIEASLDPLVTIAPDGRITDVNSATEVVTGLSRDKLIGTDFCDYFVEPDRAREGYLNVFKEGSVKDYPLDIRHSDGHVTPVLYNATIYRDESGEVIGVFAAARDVTERKKMEETRLFLASIVDSSDDAIIGKTLEGIVTSWNTGAMKLYGYTDKEIIGKNITMLAPPGFDEEILSILDRIKHGEPTVHYETSRKTKDGRIINVSLTTSPIKDANGNIIGASTIARDISERMRNEEAIKFASAYNRSLIEASLDPLVTISPDGKITDVNEATEKATGYPRDMLIGTDFSNYFTVPAKAKVGYQKAFEEGSVRDYPLEILHSDGHIVPVLYNASVYRDEAGKVIGVFAAARDITERRRAEEVARIASAYNRSLIEASLDPLVTISPDGVITDVNEATEKVTGYSREDLIGTDFSIYFTEPIKAKEGYLKAFKEGYVTDYPLEIRRNDGHITPVVYNATVYRDEAGKVIGVFAAARDITDRKRAEETIKQANAYNRSLIEASMDPLVTIAPDGKITDVNVATETVTGYSRQNLIGTDFSFYFTDQAKAREGYLRAFEKGSVKDYPLEIRNKNGRLTPVLYNATVYRDLSGKVIGVFAAARDITERKRAEEALLKARGELEMRVEERTSQLKRSNDELSVQIEERKRAEMELIDARTMAEFYLDLMGHDINNMNQVGIGFLELALNSPDILDRDREFLLKSLGSLESSSRLIENVRKVQKVRSGELKHVEVDACQAITLALARYSNLPGVKATFNYDLPPSCPVVANDFLYEVFDNLVGNAIKHAGPEPVIGINFDKTSLNGDVYCVFALEDNGPGIPDDLKDKIFNRLQRGATKVKGSGLGLYLVKSLVEDFHGTVHVEDRIKGDHTKGARFVVMLPAVEK